MTYFVQVYKSNDLNSPPLRGQTGSTITLFNACLVDGYSGSVSITSLTRSGATATATVSEADGLKLKSGQILTISGVTGPSGGDPALYNGTFEITVTSTTTFTYVMTGTPSGTATGTIVGSLKLPISSITRGGVGNLTATVTTSNVNTTLISGNWITIEGCTSTGAAQYNGTFQITYISSSSFSYQMSSDPGADATTTNAVYYKAGLQWTRPFAAGTNSQTYKSQATVGANGETYIPRYLQVIDNGATAGGAKESQMYGAESMTADQTDILGQFPTTTQMSQGICFRKATAINSTERAWTIWGDEKTFTVVSFTNDNTIIRHGITFGYFISFKSGDLYNTFIAGDTTFNNYNSYNRAFSISRLAQVAPGTGFYICRSFNQMGTSCAGLYSGMSWDVNAYDGGSIFSGLNSAFLYSPNGADGGYYVAPVFIHDTVGTIRGRLPGTYVSLQGVSMNEYDLTTNIIGLTGVTLMAVYVGNYGSLGMALVDTFGPWT